MTQDNEEFYNENNSVINMRGILTFLSTAKIYIPIIIITLLATFISYTYLSNIAPYYKASSSFRTASDDAMISLNELEFIDVTKLDITTDFIDQLTSLKLQLEVFNEFNLLENLNLKDIDSIPFVGSVNVTGPEMFLEGVIEVPYTLSMGGANAKNISKYLKALMVSADNKTIFNIVNLNKQKRDERINKISSEIKYLLMNEELDRLSQIQLIKEENQNKIRKINTQIKTERFIESQKLLNKIAELYDSASLAKSMGIIENNFNVRNETLTPELIISIRNSSPFPEWYVYGERTILEKIKMLEDRANNDLFIPSLIDLKAQLLVINNEDPLKALEAKTISTNSRRINKLTVEKNRLKNSVENVISISSMQLVTPAQSKLVRTNLSLKVFLVFFTSFLISIALALLFYSLRSEEESTITK
mgnify:FL=1